MAAEGEEEEELACEEGPDVPDRTPPSARYYLNINEYGSKL